MAEILLTIRGEEQGVSAAVDKATAQIDRLSNAIKEINTAFSESGSIASGMKSISSAAGSLAAFGDSETKLEKFIVSFKAVVREISDASGTLKTGSDKIKESVDTIKTSLNDRGTATGEPAIIGVIRGINGISGNFTSSAQAILTGGGNVSVGLGMVAKSIDDINNSLANAENIASGITRIGESLAHMNAAIARIGNVGENAGRIIAFLNGLSRSATGFVQATESIVANSTQIANAIGIINNVIASTNTANTGTNGIVRFIRDIGVATPQFITAANDILTNATRIAQAMNVVAEAGNVLSSLGAASRNVRRFSEAVSNAAQSLVRSADTINQNADRITGSIETLAAAGGNAEGLGRSSRQISRFATNVKKNAPIIADAMEQIRGAMSGGLPTVNTPTINANEIVQSTNVASGAARGASKEFGAFLKVLGVDSSKAQSSFVKSMTASAGTAFGFAKSLDGIIGHVTSMTRGLNVLGSSVRQLGQALQNAGMTASIFISLPLQSFLKDSLSSIIELSQQMIEVSKTTDLAGESTHGFAGVLDVVRRDLEIMAARYTPTTANELAKLAIEAGRAGIVIKKAGESFEDYSRRAYSAIMDFVWAADMMVNSTDVSAEKASQFFSQMISLFPEQELVSKLQNLGSVINSLGQVISRGEDDIIEAMLRAAPAFNAFNTPIEQVAALSAALIQLSASPERAGTALASFVEQFIEKIDTIASVTGMSVQQIKDSLDKDLVGTIMGFIQRLRGFKSEAERSVFLEQVFGERQSIEVAQKLAVAFDEVNGLLQYSNQEFKEGASLVNEFARAMLGPENQLKVVRNALMDIGYAFQSILAPILRDFASIAINVFNMVADAIRGMTDEERLLLLKKVALVAIAGPLAIIFGSLAFAIGIATTALTALIGGISYSVTSLGLLGTVLTNIIAVVLTGSIVLKTRFVDALDGIAGTIEGLANKARSWGANFVAQIAAGILDGAAQVIRAVSYVAGIISSFFEPGSPPDEGPLSDIDKWGYHLMRVFLDGFKNTDFSVLSDIANVIRDLLARAVNLGQLSQVDLIQFVQSARLELAALIEEFNRTGIIAQDRLGRITQGLGAMAEDVQRLITLQLQLNKVINDIKDIDKRRKALRKSVAEQIRALMLIKGLSAKDRAARIAAILADQRKQESGLNRERDLLNDRRDTLQEEYDKQKGIVDVFRDQVNLQGQLLSSIKSLVNAMENIDKVAGKNKDKDIIGKLPESLGENSENAKQFFSAGTEGLLSFMTQLQDGEIAIKAFLAAFRGGMQGLFDMFDPQEIDRLSPLVQRMVDLGLTLNRIKVKAEEFFGAIKTGYSNAKTQFAAFSQQIEQGFNLDGFANADAGPIVKAAASIGVALKIIQGYVAQFVAAFDNGFNGKAAGAIGNFAQVAGSYLGAFVKAMREAFADPAAMTKLKNSLLDIASVILGILIPIRLFRFSVVSMASNTEFGLFLKRVLFGKKAVKLFGSALKLLLIPLSATWKVLQLSANPLQSLIGLFGRMAAPLAQLNLGLFRLRFLLSFLPGILKSIGLKKFAAGLLNIGKEGIGGLLKSLLGVGKISIGPLVTIIKTIATFAGKISLIGIVITAVIAIFTGFFNFIIKNFDYVRGQVMKFIANLLDGMGGIDRLKERFSSIFASLKKIFGIFSVVGYALAGVFFAILPTIGAVIGFIINLVLGFIDIILFAVGGLIDIIGSIINAFKTGDWGHVWETIASVFTSIVGKIGGLLSPIWDAIVNFFNSIDWGAIWETVKTGIASVFSSIGAFFSGLFGGGGKAPGDAAMSESYINGAKVKAFFTQLFQEVPDLIIGLFGRFVTWLTNPDGLVDKVLSAFNTVKTKVFEIITELLTGENGIITKFTNAFDAIKKVIITSIISGVNGLIGAVEDGINRVVEAINDLIEGANRLLRSLHLPVLETIARVTLGRIPIPEFARGGIVTGPTLGLLGEAGPEMVIPLSAFMQDFVKSQQEKQPQWIVNVNHPVVREERDIDKIVQRVSATIGRRSARLGRIGAGA